jgi:hypothetical protein
MLHIYDNFPLSHFEYFTFFFKDSSSEHAHNQKPQCLHDGIKKTEIGRSQNCIGISLSK